VFREPCIQPCKNLRRVARPQFFEGGAIRALYIVGEQNQDSLISFDLPVTFRIRSFGAEDNARPSDDLPGVLLQAHDYIALIKECPRTVRLMELQRCSLKSKHSQLQRPQNRPRSIQPNQRANAAVDALVPAESILREAVRRRSWKSL